MLLRVDGVALGAIAGRPSASPRRPGRQTRVCPGCSTGRRWSATSRRPGTQGPAGAASGSIEELTLAVAQQDQAVLELLYGCGLRVAELCGLDIGDLDLDR